MAIGDHLVRRYLGFDHHGIDQGDGTVIEYGGKETGILSVRCITIDQFYGSEPRYRMVYPPGTTLPPDQVVALSRLRLTEQRYDVFDNNCEHLAFLCKTGRHMSPQADKLRGALQLALLVAGITAVAKAIEKPPPPKRKLRSRSTTSRRRGT